jgi:hypothetical protein
MPHSLHRQSLLCFFLWLAMAYRRCSSIILFSPSHFMSLCAFPPHAA